MKIMEPGPVAEQADLDRLETEIGKSLPLDYREFLMKYNGGIPEPATFAVPSHEEGTFDIQVFFGLSRTVESSNLLWNYREYRTYLGADSLPIACTETNDLVLLSLNDSSYGQVKFFDAAAESSVALHVISDRFLDLLSQESTALRPERPARPA